jgi:glutaredoxin-like protein NrdH
MDVHLYALSTCPYCRMARKFLEDSGVAFSLTEVDLLEGEPRESAIAEVKRLSGGTSFPVLVAREHVVVGFNKSRIAELLGI